MELKNKILVCDIDGTLVDSEKKIPPRAKELITKFQKNGGIFILASGRPPRGMINYANELELAKYNGYMMSYNGSQVTNMKTGEIIYKKCLDYNKIPDIIRIAKEYGVNMLTYEGDTIITEDDSNKYLQLEKKINNLDLKLVDSITDYVKFDVPKCLGTAEGEALEPLEAAFNEQLTNVSIFRSEPFFLEVNPLGIDKGNILKMVVEEILGCTKNNVVACGDGFNDITMLEYAGIGIAMDNGSIAVKEDADYVTASNDEDGLALAIEKFIF